MVGGRIWGTVDRISWRSPVGPMGGSAGGDVWRGSRGAVVASKGGGSPGKGGGRGRGPSV